MSDFGNMLRVTTTKPHRCEWCGEQIPTHTECGNYRGKWQGDWQNWYMHPECEEAYSKDDNYGDGFSPYENERPKSTESRQEHSEIMAAIGVSDEGDFGGQEHSEIMREIMGH